MGLLILASAVGPAVAGPPYQSDDPQPTDTVIRELKREGDKLVYSSPAAPFSSDGRMSVVTLVWEKVQ